MTKITIEFPDYNTDGRTNENTAREIVHAAIKLLGETQDYETTICYDREDCKTEWNNRKSGERFGGHARRTDIDNAQFQEISKQSQSNLSTPLSTGSPIFAPCSTSP